ncbi:MAG: lipoate--protein ligase family protein [Candidatus Bathyarchaeota archaeon]|nr:MAG: lipoate--protein ligase family protein [Candidatus Bathyarchaeota archaeon]
MSAEHNSFKPQQCQKSSTKDRSIMDTWRLIPLETHNAFMNMAIDEAILISHTENLVPNTLRLYQWQPSSVSIGKNQNSHEQVYLDNCRRLGVDLVRRNSGGGAVYHDQKGELTYSITAQIRDLSRTADIIGAYTSIYAAITDALRLFGVAADFSLGDTKNCPNLTVKGKKISGSAQTLKRNVVQQHGTLLLSVDLPRMFHLLRVPFTNNCTQAAQIAQRKITSVQNELGHAVTAETAANVLTQGFTATLKIHLKSSPLTMYEQALAKKLYTWKYSTASWNQKGTLKPYSPNAT